ncbi:MAG: hypothetical protein NT050_02920 [Verrucomicrobia bacterium]|nr:hypothetical protein [Verrucomicrobiota bacterium]
MKQNNFKKRSENYLKDAFSVRFSRAAVFALAILFQCCFITVCTANNYAAAGLVLAGATLIKDIFGGTSTVTHHMMIFDKTYTRKYFGVLVSDKYLMNVLPSQKMVCKQTYTLNFPDQTIPRIIENTNAWEFNQGGTEMGDHQIEVRDFVCKHGGDYGGMDIDLKVSFTMKVKWTTEAVHILHNRARVTISGWNEEHSDCTGWPNYNVGSLIDWSAEILENGEAQVKVSSTKPSFKVNRSYGEGGSMAVTVN